MTMRRKSKNKVVEYCYYVILFYTKFRKTLLYKNRIMIGSKLLEKRASLVGVEIREVTIDRDNIQILIKANSDISPKIAAIRVKNQIIKAFYENVNVQKRTLFSRDFYVATTGDEPETSIKLSCYIATKRENLKLQSIRNKKQQITEISDNNLKGV